jgi:hypothetical protein
LIATELVKQFGIFPSTVEKDALAEALVAAFSTLGNFFLFNVSVMSCLIILFL